MKKNSFTVPVYIIDLYLFQVFGAFIGKFLPASSMRIFEFSDHTLAEICFGRCATGVN